MEISLPFSNLNVLMNAKFGIIQANAGTALMNKCSIGHYNFGTVHSLYVSGSTRITNDLLVDGNMVLGNIAQKKGLALMPSPQFRPRV